MHSETVTVKRPGTVTDAYSGEAKPSWDVAPSSTFDVVTLAPPEPRPSDEPVADARNAVTSGWTLYLPLTDVAIRAGDRISVRGVDYPVQGDPSLWDDAGQVVQTFKVEG